MGAQTYSWYTPPYGADVNVGPGAIPAAIFFDPRGTDVTFGNAAALNQHNFGVYGDEKGSGKQRRTVLHFINQPLAPLTKGSTQDHGSLEVYDFEKDLVMFKGANVALQVSFTDTTNITGTTTWNVGLGSAAVADHAIDSTHGGDLVGKTAFTGSASPLTADARSITVASGVGAPQLFDGTGTAIKLYVNIDGGTDGSSLAATSTSGFTLNGVIEFDWEAIGYAL